MIKVAGNWELSWNTPIKEAELWNLLLHEYKISDWYMWPVSGIRLLRTHTVNLHERHTFKDILAENEDLIHVYFEPYNPTQQKEQGIDLREFEHPKDVLYIFGSSHFNPVGGNKKDGDSLVVVPTICNGGNLWPHQCLAICFYDRLLKGWEGK